MFAKRNEVSLIFFSSVDLHGNSVTIPFITISGGGDGYSFLEMHGVLRGRSTSGAKSLQGWEGWGRGDGYFFRKIFMGSGDLGKKFSVGP